MTQSSTMPEARAFTEAALENLNNSLSEATDPSDFLARADAIISSHENVLLLPVSYGTADPITPGTGTGIDTENALKVHEYLGEMDRANAADSRLWTYLALATYRVYMEARWPLLDDKNWKNRARDRWLLPRVTRGKLVRHGIARLWWIAHLTYHPTGDLQIQDDHYAFTRQVFLKEDRINAIFDREIGAIPTVVSAVLENLATAGDRASEGYVRNLMRGLTLAHGYRDIGVLNAQDMRTLVTETAMIEAG